MKVIIEKSNIRGKVRIPSSKSLTIRGLMCAALSEGDSKIVHPLVSEDTDAAAGVLEKIGVNIRKEGDVWWVSGGKLRQSAEELYCGESATTMRFMMAVCSLIPGKHRLTGGPSLTRRPVKLLVEALQQLGIEGSTEGKTTPPVTIEGGTLKGGLTEIPGNVSSQFISALLLVAPLAQKEVIIRLTTPLTSRPYILMTLQCLKQFGINVRSEEGRYVVQPQKYRPARLNVEGDWSSAAYFLALGAASGEGIKVENLNTDSLQGDRVMLDFLRSMGAEVQVSVDAVTVRQDKLRAIRADFTDCIDLLPTMAVLAALAEGVSEFTGIATARLKESDRVAAVKEGLLKMGVKVNEDADRLTISGLKAAENKEPIVIDSHDDHRVVMAFSVAGVVRGGIAIEGAECVAKTFPGFWETLKKVGGEVEINE